MKNNINIEDLFRNTFDNYQADVKPELWNAIQSKLPVGNVAGASTAAKGVVAGAKISASAIIIAASVVMVTAVSLVLYHSNNKKPVLSNSQKIEKPFVVDESKVVSNSNSETSLPEGNTEIQINDDKQTKSSEVSSSLKSSTEKFERKSAKDVHAVNQTLNEGQVLKSSASAGITSPNSENKEVSTSASSSQTLPENKPDHSETITGSNDDNTSSPEQSQSKKKKSLEVSDYFGQIPNSFSPNGDGQNDLFMVHPKDIKSFTVTIFDRSGKQIHQWNNPNGFWDGLANNGQEMPKGIYYYMIIGETMDGQSIKTKLSSLTLFR